MPLVQGRTTPRPLTPAGALAIALLAVTTGADADARTASTTGSPSAAPGPDGISPGWADFDNDGYADLVIGSPYEDAAVIDAGVIWVMYGGPNGLDDARNRVWYQNNPGVGDSAEEGDHFGWSLAVGRFDEDAYDDLAVGVPHEDDESKGAVDSGGFNILYGSPDGLVADSRQPFRGLTAPQNGREYGFALAAANIGSGGVDELIVGDPGGNRMHGLGSRFLDPDQSTFSTFDFDRCAVATEARYGAALAVGNFSSESGDEIAIGAPLDDVPAGGGIIAADAGSVCILTPEAIRLRQGHELPGTPETADRFGQTLAAGRLNSDGYDDLAIGTPLEDVGSVKNAGQVTVIRAAGDGSGLKPAMATTLTLNSVDMPGSPTKNDRMGQALAITDLGGPTLPDLVIGIPNEDVAGATDAGAVIVRYSGRPTSETDLWTQATSGIAETAQAGDHFGTALHGADFDDDGPGDLVIGVPDEDIGGVVNVGALNVIYGTSANGLSANGDQFWHQDATGISGSPETDDRFGLKLP